MAASLQKLFTQQTGQGFHGHRGRPGKQGGSLPRGITRTEISDLAKRWLKYDRDAYIDKVERILDEMPLSPRLEDIAGEVNLDVSENMGSSYAGHFGNTIQVSRGAVEGKFEKSLAEAYRSAPTVLHGVVAHELGHHIQGRLGFAEVVEWNELIEDRNLFSGFKKNKLPDIEETFASPLRGNELFAESFAYYMWDPTKLPEPVLSYMDSISGDVIKNQKLFKQTFEGHKGRPNKVGGSLPRSASSEQYREFDTNSRGDTVMWGKNILDEAHLDTKETSSLYQYKGDSNPINERLRSEKLLPEHLSKQDQIDTLDRAISKSKLPESVYTFRGINRNVLGPDTGDYTGVEFEDRGFVSTTLHVRSALGWSWMNGDSVGMVVKIPLSKGSDALYLDDIYDRGEYELLLPRNMKFKVVKDETVDRFGVDEPWRLLTVEVIK